MPSKQLEGVVFNRLFALTLHHANILSHPIKISHRLAGLLPYYYQEAQACQ
jgi:hypothetical protein